MNYKKLFLFVVLIISLFVVTSKAQAGTTPLKGWGWSSNIGWISFSSTNPGAGTGSAYGVNFSTTTGSSVGDFGGFAWSPNIGWVSFDATDGTHPSASTDLATGLVTGWARACAGTVSGDCLGASRTDGWDGWIRLSDTGDASPKYPSGFVDGSKGITFDPATGNFKGYAWGDVNVGWFAFSSNVGVPFTPPNCEPNCGGGEEVSDLDLTVNADGTGWYSSTSITAREDNTATVKVRWELDNVSNVQIANNTDGVIGWPGASLGATSYNGAPFSSDSSVEGVSVTFTGITATTIKKLRLSYWDNMNDIHYKEVAITITPYGVPPVLNCPTPTNAQLCTGSSYAPNMTSTLRATSALCTSATTPLSCEFYCPQGFKIVGNMCRRSGTIIER